MKIKSKKFASDSYLSQLNDLWNWYQSDRSELEVYSSGTTGAPRSIVLDREAIMASAQMSVNFFGLNASSIIGLSLPLDKIGGIMLAFRAFLVNATILPISPQLKPLESITDESLDFISMVPNQLMASKNDWYKARQILIGGGPLSTELESMINDSAEGTVFWHSYASTETLSHVAIRSLGPGKTNQYKALEGVRFTRSKDSCLVISAPSLNLKNLETKDIVDLIDDQSFIWRGRKDNVVLSGGLKLYPEEIERELSLPFPFFLASRADADLGQKLVLVIRERDYDQSLIQSLKNQLSGPKKPKSILLTKEFKWTETNKIRREESLKNVIREIKL